MINNFKKSWLIIIALATIILGFFLFFYERPTSWHVYYQEKLKQPTRPLLLKALDFTNTQKGIALDLGAGASNETAHLLKNGWGVIAIDADPKSISIINERKDIDQYRRSLTTIESSFEDINWQNIPPCDLIFASYALPFVPPNQFNAVWRHVVDKIKKGGLFAGSFFNKEFNKISEKQRKHMTFFSKEEFLALFNEFTIEYFNEDENCFEIIARKKIA
jgi:SAM-dependent methyltransferase